MWADEYRKGFSEEVGLKLAFIWWHWLRGEERRPHANEVIMHGQAWQVDSHVAFICISLSTATISCIYLHYKFPSLSRVILEFK